MGEAIRTIWIGNVEPWMNEAYIAQVFADAGPVANVKLVRDPTRGSTTTGFGFVQFTTHECARDFMERVGGGQFTTADGHRLKVNWSSSCLTRSTTSQGTDGAEYVVYVGNLELKLTDVGLFNIFAKRYPSVSSAKVVVDQHLGLSRGFGFVRFKEFSEAEDAIIRMQGTIHSSKPLKVRWAQKQILPSGQPLSGASMGAPTHAVPGMGVDGNQTGRKAAGGHSIVIAGTYPGLSNPDIASQFGIFGVVLRACSAPEQQLTVVAFRDRVSAELAVRHMQEQVGVQALLMDGWEGSAESLDPAAASELLMRAAAQTTSQLRSYLQEQLAMIPSRPSVQHFHVLLQDPSFAEAFRRELEMVQAQGGTVHEAVHRTFADALERAPWLQQDRPGLFDASLNVRAANDAFLPALSGARAVGRRAPVLPGWLRVVS